MAGDADFDRKLRGARVSGPEIIFGPAHHSSVRFWLGMVGAGNGLFAGKNAARWKRLSQVPEQSADHRAVKRGFGHLLENLAVKELSILGNKA